MSIIASAIAAINLHAGEEKRRGPVLASGPGDWLLQILQQNDQIESALAAVRAATNVEARENAKGSLRALLVGSSMPEQVVIFPALGRAGKTTYADVANFQQADKHGPFDDSGPSRDVKPAPRSFEASQRRSQVM